MQLNMDLTMDLLIDNQKETKKAERVKEATQKKTASAFQPTWEQVWITGYETPTGSQKKGIFQTKITESDKEKLIEVKKAVESGEIGIGVEEMKKFSKSHAMNLYRQLKEIRREGIIKKMVEEKPSNYILVTEEDQLETVVEQLASEEEIGLDTETTGVEHTDRIVGISMTLPKHDMHYYIPYGHTTGEKQLKKEVVLQALKPQLERTDLKCILHNAKFDVHMFIKEGITIGQVFMDTMVCMGILNENEMSFALKNLATKYGKFFGFEDKSMTYEELFGKGGFQGTPLDIATVYACKDTHLCWKFSLWQREMMDKQPKLHNIYFNIEQRITPVCIHMEQAGFLIDMDFAKAYEQELEQEIKSIEQKLNEYFGDININSNAQLQTKLYDELGLTDVSGKRSVDKSALKMLKNEHEGVGLLLDYRALTKLHSTYIQPLPQKVWEDGRLHGSFNQTATVTGRFASNNPNLQNLPAKARHMIVAPEGKLIMGGDFSQQEPRILSHISKDEHLQHPYLTGQDLYSTLASTTFKVPIEECLDGSKYRKMMKMGLLAVMYGTSMFTLSEQLGITVEEADQFIKDFFEAYPKVAQFIRETNAHADEYGFVQTIDGRKRRFIGHQTVAKQFKQIEAKITSLLGRKPDNIWAEEIPHKLKQQYWAVAKDYQRVSRQSVNAIIQGSSADMTKKVMVKLYDWVLQKEGWKILATVHDEVLLEVPDTITPEEVEEFRSIMINTCKYDVPMKTDIEVMVRWGSGVPINKWFEKGMDCFDENKFAK